MKKLFLILMLSMIGSIYGDDIVRTISITGTGEMLIKPDTVVISTGVNSGNPDIGKALEHNNSTMVAIFEGLADLGITEEKIKTNNYNVYLFRPYNDEDDNPEEYRVSNSIEINIKELDLVDTVIDQLITLGANKINGIYFTFENEAAYQLELRIKAMENARSKAEFLASLEDMKISSVLSITEEGASNSRDTRNYEYAMASTLSKSAVSSGMEKLTLSYNVTYQIVPK